MTYLGLEMQGFCTYNLTLLVAIDLGRQSQYLKLICDLQNDFVQPVAASHTCIKIIFILV